MGSSGDMVGSMSNNLDTGMPQSWAREVCLSMVGACARLAHKRSRRALFAKRAHGGGRGDRSGRCDALELGVVACGEVGGGFGTAVTCAAGRRDGVQTGVGKGHGRSRRALLARGRHESSSGGLCGQCDALGLGVEARGEVRAVARDGGDMHGSWVVRGGD